MPLTSTSNEEPFVDDRSSDSPESLVLDIGDDIGALILYADESCLGREIDLTPVGHPQSHQTHTMIRRRRSVDSEFIAGVYPELREGTYTVWSLDEGPLAEVTIGGGRITELDVGDCAGPGSDPEPSSR
jgi:hypothetical protein